MVPRTPMPNIKNKSPRNLFFIVMLAVFVSGCSRPGPRALIEGKQLIDQGDYQGAIGKLRLATSLLRTNAQAWNYLGLACQHAGQLTNAWQAYQRALNLDHDLPEPHYNLGCLWLEQHRLASAGTEFTTYTLRRSRSPEGWMKLGTTQLRSVGVIAASARAPMLEAAEKNLREALRLDPRNLETLNALGLVKVQQRRAQEGAQYFAEAVKQKRDYAPALLNLAVVEQLYLSEPQRALQTYRKYLTLPERRPDWQAVYAVARELEQELAPKSARQTVAAPHVR